PDGRLEPDPGRRRAVRLDRAGLVPQARGGPALGDAQGVEFLDYRDAEVARGGQRSQAAGPAQRVHDVGPVALQVAAQRAAEGGNLLEQVRVIGFGGHRAGVDVLDPHALVQFGLLGQVGQVLLGVDRYLVTLAGELAGELTEPDVVTVRAGAGAGVERRRVLGYYGDLHGGLSRYEPRCRRSLARDGKVVPDCALREHRR